jgi:elongation factor P hydroxylase
MKTKSFNYNDLVILFDQTFAQSYQTRLIKGGDEPIYLPKDTINNFNQIVFARGYFASALHEISHWLVAGDKRRLLEDYGYWYSPDGRDQKTQLSFEKVEVKPQAIEWALSVACGHPFSVSTDNLSGWQSCRHQFKEKVYEQLTELVDGGFNDRTLVFIDVLQKFYHQSQLTLSNIGYQPSLNEVKENYEV